MSPPLRGLPRRMNFFAYTGLHLGKIVTDCLVFLKAVNSIGSTWWGDIWGSVAANTEAVMCYHSSLPLQHF